MRWSGVWGAAGRGVLPSPKSLAAEALKGFLFRVSALVALDVLETAEALLTVPAGQSLRLLPAAAVLVGVGSVALGGGFDACERHRGGWWVCGSPSFWSMRMMIMWSFVSA